jgi:hypothetical protein
MKKIFVFIVLVKVNLLMLSAELSKKAHERYYTNPLHAQSDYSESYVVKHEDEGLVHPNSASSQLLVVHSPKPSEKEKKEIEQLKKVFAFFPNNSDAKVEMLMSKDLKQVKMIFFAQKHADGTGTIMIYKKSFLLDSDNKSPFSACVNNFDCWKYEPAKTCAKKYDRAPLNSELDNFNMYANATLKRLRKGKDFCKLPLDDKESKESQLLSIFYQNSK